MKAWLMGIVPQGNGWIEVGGPVKHPENGSWGMLMYNATSKRYWLGSCGSVVGVPQAWARSRCAEITATALVDKAFARVG